MLDKKTDTKAYKRAGKKSDEIDAPTKAEMTLLEPFAGLTLAQIIVPETIAEFEAATADLMRCRFVGFDTESRPTFQKGEASAGPHIVQLTTLEHAYIFQLYREESHRFLTEIIESTHTVKVGFGLKSDKSHLRRKLGVTPKAILDMDKVFRQEGYRKELGVKAAVAILFQQRFQKSKSATMSNWGAGVLKNNQLLYAANDAYAALKVLSVMNKDESELPITDV
ncbi:3'-5' exonuclease [Neptunomonas antarctica]|uniref:3'-5' exonuclease n=1 Tax=Neptunomonas antarctica TaxID=619304 RepID=A0A1N7LKC1_9GAMM|nr:3'-5' exonuclease [Neptunomonas antarctica]SIS74266.1 3'-5' exonuclease [Neptunomonas antarctica]